RGRAVYRAADDLSTLTRMQPYQRDLLQKASRPYQEVTRRTTAISMALMGTAHASLQAATIKHLLGRRRRMARICRDIIAFLQRLTGDGLGDPSPTAEPQPRLVLGEAYSFLGQVLANAGHRLQAEESCRRAIVLYEKLAAAHSNTPEYGRRLAEGYNV